METTMAFSIDKIYDDYVAMCKRCGVEPASFETWKYFAKA
jgi:hypothetical protein